MTQAYIIQLGFSIKTVTNGGGRRYKMADLAKVIIGQSLKDISTTI